MTGAGERSEPPTWFARAVADRPRRNTVQASGVGVHYRSWGRTGRPPLVLVHGAGAHSGWWDHLAPLIRSHRVVAVDLSGHGDSGHRDHYDMSDWSREILAVAAAEGLHRPILVGHSMGGRAAVTTAVEHPGSVAAVVCVDTPLTRRRPGSAARHDAVRVAGVYPTAEEAIARFRTRPRQEGLPAHVRDHVARESLRAVAGGWTWKADQGVFGRGLPMQDLLPRLRCPVALVRGEHGLVPPAMVAEMRGLVTGPLPVIELPDAGHHPMLDQPLVLLTALRALLALWPVGSAGGTGS